MSAAFLATTTSFLAKLSKLRRKNTVQSKSVVAIKPYPLGRICLTPMKGQRLNHGVKLRSQGLTLTLCAGHVIKPVQ